MPLDPGLVLIYLVDGNGASSDSGSKANSKTELDSNDIRYTYGNTDPD